MLWIPLAYGPPLRATSGHTPASAESAIAPLRTSRASPGRSSTQSWPAGRLQQLIGWPSWALPSVSKRRPCWLGLLEHRSALAKRCEKKRVR